MRKICPECGREFFASTSKKYCSKRCRSESFGPAPELCMSEGNPACWTRKKAAGGCSWSRSFRPVEGWTAKKTLIRLSPCQKEDVIESYQVIACPEYEKDDKRYRR